MPDASAHALRMTVENFWAPVPWMLEAAIALELTLAAALGARALAKQGVLSTRLSAVDEAASVTFLACH